MSALDVCLRCLRYLSQVMQACADGYAARAPAEVVGLCAVLEALDKGERCVCVYVCIYSVCIYIEICMS